MASIPLDGADIVRFDVTNESHHIDATCVEVVHGKSQARLLRQLNEVGIHHVAVHVEVRPAHAHGKRVDVVLGLLRHNILSGHSRFLPEFVL